MSSKQLVVLGMHRSGTSMLTQLLHLMGAYVGPPAEMVPANDQNPKGFWERIDANTIDREILRLCGGTWCFLSAFCPSRLDPADRERMAGRIGAVVADLAAHPVSVIKEPRMCLLFDLWRPHLPAPVCVLMVRRPTEVAASLRRRDGFSAQVGIALWEVYTRAALNASMGLPRCIVWHHELMAHPSETIGALHASLCAAGVKGLRVPTDAEWRDAIEPDLRSRNGLESDTGEFLNAAQADLYRYLQQGDLSQAVSADGSLGARETLRCFQDDHVARVRERMAAAGREQAVRDAYDARLETLRTASDVLFDSLRWRFGHGVFSVLDRLSGGVDAPQPADVLRGTLRSDNGSGLPPVETPDASPAVLFDRPRARRVVAVMFVHNEERFIEGAIRHLAAHGVEVYLCDNGSTDATIEIARPFLGGEVLRIERIPRGPYYDLRSNLNRLEELSGILGADWILRADPDARHLPPEPGRTLAEAFAQIEEQGYNAVNFIECTFVPTREQPDHDHAAYESTMTWYYPFAPRRPFQATAWRQPDRPVEIAWSGGHEVRFPGRRICPRDWVMKHYLFLSRDHAVRKYVQREFDPAGMRRGWHGWRATLKPEDIDMPPQQELRPWPEDDVPDISDPWTQHWLEREAAGRHHG